MLKDLIMKWWFWVFVVVPLVSFLLVFILAMTYAIHPAEFRIYANDEMVATTKNVMMTSKDSSFNACLTICNNVDKAGDGWAQKYLDCYYSCENHYDNETSSNILYEKEYNNVLNKCMVKLKGD